MSAHRRRPAGRPGGRHARRRRSPFRFLRVVGVAGAFALGVVLSSCGSDMPATPDQSETAEDPIEVSQCVSAA